MNAIQNLQRFRAIGGSLHGKAALFEKAANGVADKHGIVDYQRNGRHEFATCIEMHAPAAG